MSRPSMWGESPVSAPRDDRQRALPTAQCSLCGIALPTGLLVPDGGQACADIRWYCKDAKSCTERWTANLPRHPHIAPTSAQLAPPTLATPTLATPTLATPTLPAPVRERALPSGRETALPSGRERALPPGRERALPPAARETPGADRRPGPEPVPAREG